MQVQAAADAAAAAPPPQQPLPDPDQEWHDASVDPVRTSCLGLLSAGRLPCRHEMWLSVRLMLSADWRHLHLHVLKGNVIHHALVPSYTMLVCLCACAIFRFTGSALQGMCIGPQEFWQVLERAEFAALQVHSYHQLIVLAHRQNCIVCTNAACIDTASLTWPSRGLLKHAMARRSC